MSNLRRIPTPDHDIERVLKLSIRQKREATLAYATGLRLEAARQYRRGGQTRHDAQLFISSLEIENCALRALLEGNDK